MTPTRIAISALGVLLVLAGCGAEDQPGDSAVYARIAGLSDCQDLQREFDLASQTHDGADTQEQSEIAIAYMEAADDRMKEVGCY